MSNKVHYFGDINPECGGCIVELSETGIAQAWIIGEFSPINFCNYIAEIEFADDSITDLNHIQDQFYNGDFAIISYSDFKFMKAIDKEYTNKSNLDLIDKFVRYDYNIYNLIRKVCNLGIAKIHTGNEVK